MNLNLSGNKREDNCGWTWKPAELKSLVMLSWIWALSAAETSKEFNASSENSRCSVRETCSPGSTIPFKTNTHIVTSHTCSHCTNTHPMLQGMSNMSEEQTPGMAHWPQSFLLMDTNWRMGRLDTGWRTFSLLESSFHLPDINRHHISAEKDTPSKHFKAIWVTKWNNL